MSRTKITRPEEPGKVRVSEVEAGDCFRFADTFYMKVSTQDSSKNVMTLQKTTLAEPFEIIDFNQDALVRVCETHILIKGYAND